MIKQQNLPTELRTKNFTIPSAYYRIFELGLTNIEPWYFLEDQNFKLIYEGIRKRYPKRLLLPFARRKDNDDVACFVVNSDDYAQGNVLVIHDYASPGNEVDISNPSFWDWFRMAIDEMIDSSDQSP